MKKLLFTLMLTALAAGCVIEAGSPIYVYIYKNESSREITVKSYNFFVKEELWGHNRDSTFVIPVGETHTLRFEYGRQPPLPLHWIAAVNSLDSAIVSNGEVQFINRNWEKDGLYNISNYTLISQKDPKRTYQYIFTDENFIDAEPINP